MFTRASFALALGELGPCLLRLQLDTVPERANETILQSLCNIALQLSPFFNN